MADIKISGNIVRKVNNLAKKFIIPGESILISDNGNYRYETSEAIKEYWDSLDETSKESIFKSYWEQEDDCNSLEELIQKDKEQKIKMYGSGHA